MYVARDLDLAFSSSCSALILHCYPAVRSTASQGLHCSSCVMPSARVTPEYAPVFLIGGTSGRLHWHTTPGSSARFGNRRKGTW
jgi:hypothetical protein